VQLSFQSDQAELGDAIAGAPAHQRKLVAAQVAREAGLALSLNFVLHRANIDRLSQMIALAEQLEAERVELANVQYYGWAFINRATLLPTRQQVETAADIAAIEKQRLAGKMHVFYVLPDYYESRPKPCMQGWGRRYLTVNPAGDALPCPTATTIPNLVFDSVREHSLDWIWTESDSFNKFRGTEWMPELCRNCPRHEIDFGGCRCQAALITGDPGRTDPVCKLSADRWLIDAACAESGSSVSDIKRSIFRQNPTPPSAGPDGFL
jgi:PqqA peptide cyclase